MNDIVGKKIIIKKEWQDNGDEKFDFIVIEDRGNRVLAQCIIWKDGLNPMEVISKDMIEKYI